MFIFALIGKYISIRSNSFMNSIKKNIDNSVPAIFLFTIYTPLFLTSFAFGLIGSLNILPFLKRNVNVWN